jgi:hypothetical protein
VLLFMGRLSPVPVITPVESMLKSRAYVVSIVALMSVPVQWPCRSAWERAAGRGGEAAWRQSRTTAIEHKKTDSL